MNNKTKEAIAQASGIVTLLQFAVSILLALLSAIKLPTTAAVSIGVGSFAVLFIAFFSFRKQRERISLYLLELWRYSHAPAREREIGVKVAEYTFHDREHMSFSSRYTVKFNSGSHDFAEDRLAWSAGLVNSIAPVVPGQFITIVPEKEKNDIQSFLGYQFFQIHFQKFYSSKDGLINTGFQLDNLQDEEHKAKTCFVASIYDKTEKIIIRIRFPAGLKVTNIRMQKFMDYLDREPYYVKQGELAVDCEDSTYHVVEFCVTRPIYGGKCAVDWDFV